MRPEEASRFVRDGGEDSLSMKALIELLKAVIEKDLFASRQMV